MTCTRCGKEYTNHYSMEVGTIMQEKNVCFECAFWIWQHDLDKAGNREFAIIDGAHYVLCPSTTGIKGNCGRKYTIRFKDGRTVECDNLWHQGIIPERFREQMPDNAEFIH